MMTTARFRDDNLSFAGHDDWRLPNVRELQSIVDFGRSVPAINQVFSTQHSCDWTSSSTNLAPKYAHYLDFQGDFGICGDQVGIEKFLRSLYYFRAVRTVP